MSYNSKYPEFSWSNSRNSLFEDCQRAYYYRYYGAHQGWRVNADETTKEIYRQKQALSLYFALSHGVRDTIRGYLEGNIQKEDFKANINRVLHNICVRAMDWKACRSNPKSNPSLVELMNYRGGFKNSVVEDIVAKVKARIKPIVANFFDTPTVKEITDTDDVSFLEILSDLDFCSYKAKIGDLEMDIWGGPDVVHKVEDKLVLTVWKTERKRREIDEHLSAQVLAIYAWRKYKVKMPEIEIRMSNLVLGSTTSYSVDSVEEYKEICGNIGKSIEKMREKVESGDLKENKPKAIEEFEKKGCTSNCMSCPFWAVCLPEEEGQSNSTQTA